MRENAAHERVSWPGAMNSNWIDGYGIWLKAQSPNFSCGMWLVRNWTNALTFGRDGPSFEYEICIAVGGGSNVSSKTSSLCVRTCSRSWNDGMRATPDPASAAFNTA
jgi:hypothetical protein